MTDDRTDAPAPQDGGAAFPQFDLDPWGKPKHSGGMPLRDWFAATIDVPWGHARAVAAVQLGRRATIREVIECRAALRYAEADAMLAARMTPPAGLYDAPPDGEA